MNPMTPVRLRPGSLLGGPRSTCRLSSGLRFCLRCHGIHVMRVHRRKMRIIFSLVVAPLPKTSLRPDQCNRPK